MVVFCKLMLKIKLKTSLTFLDLKDMGFDLNVEKSPLL